MCTYKVKYSCVPGVAGGSFLVAIGFILLWGMSQKSDAIPLMVLFFSLVILSLFVFGVFFVVYSVRKHGDYLTVSNATLVMRLPAKLVIELDDIEEVFIHLMIGPRLRVSQLCFKLKNPNMVLADLPEGTRKLQVKKKKNQSGADLTLDLIGVGIPPAILLEELSSVILDGQSEKILNQDI